MRNHGGLAANEYFADFSLNGKAEITPLTDGRPTSRTYRAKFWEKSVKSLFKTM